MLTSYVFESVRKDVKGTLAVLEREALQGGKKGSGFVYDHIDLLLEQLYISVGECF